MNLTKAMEWITEELSKGNRDFAQAIQEKLKTYDWKTDETNLYSYTKRKARLDQSYTTLALQETLAGLSGEFEVVKRQLVQDSIDQAAAKNQGYQGSELGKMLTEIKAETKDAITSALQIQQSGTLSFV